MSLSRREALLAAGGAALITAAAPPPRRGLDNQRVPDLGDRKSVV